ncbi:MAG: ABC transporter permease [Cyclobacteriaceae bacterium]
MFRNYFVTTLRNLLRNKVYAFLNIVGLALGIGCSVVIFKVIQYETSFDKHHTNYADIYRIVTDNIYPDRVDHSMGTPHPVGPALREDYPELDVVVRTFYHYSDQIHVLDENGNKKKFLFDQGIVFTEAQFFDVFSVDWLVGDQANALKSPGTVVITQSMAKQLYNLNEDQLDQAIGKLLNLSNAKDFEVVGVVADPPENTNFAYKFLVDYESMGVSNPYFEGGTRWGSTSSNTNTYFLAREGFDLKAFEKQLVDFVEKYHGENASEDDRYVVQKLSEIHFDREYGNYVGGPPVEMMYAFGFIALFLILTACINFINLATAQSVNRSKEIGIRKAIGGMNAQLVTQFMSEIALITLISLMLSLMISELMFILLEDVLGYRLNLNLFAEPTTLLFLTAVFVIVSFLSGLYPSLLLSRMNAVLALKNKISAKSHSGGLSLRKGLVIMQFAISQFLIAGTLIVVAQMDYFINKDLGFNSEAIVTTYLPDQDEVLTERFKQHMLSSSLISDITFSLSQPSGNSNSHSNFNYAPLQSEKNYHANFKPCDDRYVEFFDIPMLAGRGIQKQDSSRNVVINRKIADLMGFENNYNAVIGEKLTSGWNGDKVVVGVMENFHSKSLVDDMDYVILLNVPRAYYSISFKVSSVENMREGLAHFQSAWEATYPDYVVDYEIYDEQLRENYDLVSRMTSMMQIFSIISILIGCLGLYGLISFIAINKIKEIGVRKVLGASVMSILALFTKEIIYLVLIAFFFAAPASYFVLDWWLRDFAFRIDLNITYFILAFVGTLFIALLTISHRTVSSAYINPAHTLKDE